jgi:hypothetical protein
VIESHPDWGPAVTFWDLIMPLFLFIVVIGSNAILAYTVGSIYQGALSAPWVGGLAKQAGAGRELVLSLGQVGVLWLILWYLYRNRTFLRV